MFGAKIDGIRQPIMVKEPQDQYQQLEMDAGATRPY